MSVAEYCVILNAPLVLKPAHKPARTMMKEGPAWFSYSTVQSALHKGGLTAEHIGLRFKVDLKTAN